MIFDERNIYRLLLMFLSLSVWQDGRMYQRISARSGDHIFPAYFKAECASLSLSSSTFSRIWIRNYCAGSSKNDKADFYFQVLGLKILDYSVK